MTAPMLAFEAPFIDTRMAIELGDYIFAIAPFLRGPKADPEYHAVIECANIPLYLDNGEYEGFRMETSEFISLGFDWSASALVAPDVIGDKDETLRLVRNFLDQMDKSGYEKEGEGYWKPDIMGVLQGKDRQDKIDCYFQYKEWGVDIIGLALGAFEKDWRARIEFSLMLQLLIEIHNSPRDRMHILGIRNIADLCWWVDIAESIDTSLPFHCAQKGLELPNCQKKGKLDWNRELDTRGVVTAFNNVKYMKEALEGTFEYWKKDGQLTSRV